VFQLLALLVENQLATYDFLTDGEHNSHIYCIFANDGLVFLFGIRIVYA